MKRIKLLSLGLVMSVGVALGVVGTTQAAWSDNLRSSEDRVTVAADATHDGSLYATGNDVTIDGTVDGTLYCAAGTVTISGTVNGDVLCGAQSIVLERGSTVTGDVRLAGQTINLDGSIAGGATAFGQDVKVGSDGEVAGDFNGGAQFVTVDGMVGDMVYGMQSLTLNGVIEGNADLSLERLVVGEEAAVSGALNYSASRELNYTDRQFADSISYNRLQQSSSDDVNWYAGIPVLFAMMLLSALVVALVMPRFVHRSSVVLRENALMTVLAGFAFAFGTPIIAALAILSVVLLPLGVALMLTWLLAGLLSGIFFAYYIGSVLLRGVENVLARMAGGAVVLLIVYLIPFVNILALFVAWVVGSGLVIMTLAHNYQRPNYSTETPKKTLAKKVKAVKKSISKK